MIIEIHNSVSSKALNEEDLERFSSLFRLRRKGKAFVIADIRLLQELIKQDFGSFDKSNIRKIINDQVLWRNKLLSLNARFILTSYEKEDNLRLQCKTGIPHFCFKEFEYTPPSIIAENLLDISFYKAVVSAYCDNVLKLKGIRLSVNEKHGGGATICDVIKSHIANSEGLALCLLDSDKSHPDDSLGQTAQKVLDQVELDDYTKIINLNVREVENIIPIDVIERVRHQKCQKAKIKQYKSLLEYDFPVANPMMYVDLKKGLKICLQREDFCEETGKYWRTILNTVGNTKECNCVNAKGCTCIFIDGFGSSLLRDVVTNPDGIKIEFNNLSGFYKKELTDLAEALVAYLLSPLPLVA